MPLFRRGGDDGRRQQQPAQFRPPVGDQPCREKGCPAQTAVPCAYVDRRRRRCPSAFCADHYAAVGGIVYCRRHAGTISAIGQHDPLGMPDLDNRAPSLVNWVAQDLGPFIRDTLQAQARPGEGLVDDPEVKVTYDPVRTRRFERSWKLADHTGVSVQITLYVGEDDDATVRVRIGAGVVAEGVPPWIERRRRHLVVSDEVDRAQRDMFYAFLQEHITAGLSHSRALDERYR